MPKHRNLLKLSNVGFYLGGKWLVRGIDLKIERGEIVTLIGPNGSGKSTTAKLSLGILTPTEGKVECSEEIDIGYLPQKVSIGSILPLKVSRFMQLTKRISAEMAKRAMEATKVEHLESSEIRTLSGGEFQRVMLARAIASTPDFLVLDEPVQGVDHNGEIAIYQLIKEIKDKIQCGILLISHDLHLVMAATDRVICLNGHVCCSGTPGAVASSTAYKELFGERATSTFAVYEHSHDHTHLPDGRVRHADGTISDSNNKTAENPNDNVLP